MSGARLALVHLVRNGEGVEGLRAFLSSYRRHDAGVQHELVLLFKGFAGPADIEDHRRLADGIAATELHVSDEGFDLTAYRSAAASLHAERCCFVNSHARVLCEGWLAHLDHALDQAGVGIAGASGSWASLRSYALMHLGLPSPYRQVYEHPRAALEQLRALELERSSSAAPHGRLRSTLYTTVALAGDLRGFESFPNHHVRTNAFLVERPLFLSAAGEPVRSKVQAHRLESGRDSITRRIERAGGRAVLVDRDGRVYEHHDWPASETFWQGDQRGLLVADNQTAAYRAGDPRRRLLLSRYAWGSRAAPGSQ